MFGAIPALTVRSVSSYTFLRISSTHSSGVMPFSLQYVVMLRPLSIRNGSKREKGLLEISLVAASRTHCGVVSFKNGHNLFRHFVVSSTVDLHKYEFWTELLGDES